jgi:CheY-like chemotaxis protein
VSIAIDPEPKISTATDPVSIIATFKKAKAQGRLLLLIDPERLLNGGTAAVEALKHIGSDAPDLLISYVAMPQLSGIDLAIEMKVRVPNCATQLLSGQDQ